MTRETHPPQRGSFITIDGPEGSGKTTQAGRLETYLRDAGLDVLRTREPGGTRLGERLRDILLSNGPVSPSGVEIDPLTDALLFNAARRQLVEEVIRPAIARGTTVVCARYADSTLAYQGYGAGIPLADLREIESIATGGLRPDLTILLDVPPEIGLRRKAPDDQTRFELAFDIDFHRRVRDGFLALAAREPERFVVVDATQSREAVWSEVQAAADSLRAGRTIGGEPERRPERIER